MASPKSQWPKFVWNVPNLLTLGRLFFLLPIPFLLLPESSHSFERLSWALVFSALGSVSDFFDGYFARKLHQESEWGAYMDPLIDKLFVWVLYTCFLFIPSLAVPWWAVLVIVGRDIFVTYVRNRAIKKGTTFTTSFLAKTKTAAQLVVGIVILVYLWISQMPELNQNPDFLQIRDYQLPAILVITVSVLTVASVLGYLSPKKEN